VSDLDGPVTRMLAADEASRALGMHLVESGSGHATVRMRVRPDMLNGHAMAHGGLIFALADTAFGCACNSHGPTTLAAGADITFLRPARVGDELEARAVERVRHGRSGIYDVTVWRGADVIAEFRGHSRTIGTVEVT
jgi:acyl-CoA thioesterase